MRFVFLADITEIAPQKTLPFQISVKGKYVISPDSRKTRLVPLENNQ